MYFESVKANKDDNASSELICSAGVFVSCNNSSFLTHSSQDGSAVAGRLLVQRSASHLLPYSCPLGLRRAASSQIATKDYKTAALYKYCVVCIAYKEPQLYLQSVHDVPLRAAANSRGMPSNAGAGTVSDTSKYSCNIELLLFYIAVLAEWRVKCACANDHADHKTQPLFIRLPLMSENESAASLVDSGGLAFLRRVPGYVTNDTVNLATSGRCVLSLSVF